MQFLLIQARQMHSHLTGAQGGMDEAALTAHQVLLADEDDANIAIIYEYE